MMSEKEIIPLLTPRIFGEQENQEEDTGQHVVSYVSRRKTRPGYGFGEFDLTDFFCLFLF